MKPSRILKLRPLLLLAIFAGSQIALAADIDHGRRLYGQHCQVCHGIQGTAQIPGAPDFSRGERLLRPNHDLILAIRHGKGMMPAFEGRFEDQAYFDLIAYLRTFWR